MATTAAEEELLRKARVSPAQRTTIGPDGAVSVELKKQDELDRIANSIAGERAASTGAVPIRRYAFGIRSGVA